MRIYIGYLCMIFMMASACSEPTKPQKPKDSTQEAPWRFVVMGDSRGESQGVNYQVLSSLVSSVISKDVDLVVFTGDMVTGNDSLQFQLSSWIGAMHPLWDAGIKVYPTRGNHEAMSDADALGIWQDSFSGDHALPTNGPFGHSKVTYLVTHKNALFISLDQYIDSHRIDQRWLDQQLAAKDVPHLFVFGHEPAFQVQHADCLDDNSFARNKFWKSLRAAGGRTYFCGHDHFYDHARVDDGDQDPSNDLHQYVVGTAGAPLRTWSPPYNGDNSRMTLKQIEHVEDFGYLLGEVDGSDVTLTWHSIGGGKGQPWGYTVP